MANTSTICQRAAHTTYQLSSPSCSTGVISRGLTPNNKNARKWWNHWKGSWKIVLIWKLSSVKCHQWKTQTYKQRESFSTHLFFSELVENPNISFVAHENLHFTPLKDTIHPNMKGSSVIARNLGRHIHNLFWERPRKIARRDLLQPYKLHPQQCTDSFGWQRCRQPWLRW